MKIILNNISKALIIMTLVMGFFSCEDPDKAPVIVFETATKGSYPRLVSDSESGSTLINPNALSSTGYGYAVEFVDETKGVDVESYELSATYKGTTTVVRSYSQSEFTTNADGFRQATVESITLEEIQDITGPLTVANVGDVLAFSGAVNKGGNSYTSANSSSTVQGAAFRAHFTFNMPVSCPSDMYVGEVNYVADYSIGWDGATKGVSGTTSIVDNSGGSFDFADWSFGGYDAFYGCCTPSGTFGFTDVCGEVTFVTEAVDSYGDQWEFHFNLDASKTVLNVWGSNYTYANGQESAWAVVTFPTAQTWNCANCEDLADFPN
jgi:hypothetical protein